MRLLKFLLLFGLANAALAADHARIQLSQQAEAYISGQLAHLDGHRIEVTAQSLDTRIHVPQCPNGYRFEVSEQALAQSNVTLKAACPGIEWYLYMVVRVEQTMPVLVARVPLSPDSLLDENNTETTFFDKQRIRSSTFADITEVKGARVKRRLRPGQPITPELLCFVCKGDRINITATVGGLSVRTSGIAQQDGNKGDTIRVENSRSKKVIDAVVASANSVYVSR